MYIVVYSCIVAYLYSPPKFCQNNGTSLLEYSLQHWEKELDMFSHCFGDCLFLCYLFLYLHTLARQNVFVCD